MAGDHVDRFQHPQQRDPAEHERAAAVARSPVRWRWPARVSPVMATPVSWLGPSSVATSGAPGSVPARRRRIGSACEAGLESQQERTPWIVGVSGASGTPYAAAVLRGAAGRRRERRPGGQPGLPADAAGRDRDRLPGRPLAGRPAALAGPGRRRQAGHLRRRRHRRAYGTGRPATWRPGRPRGRTPSRDADRAGLDGVRGRGGARAVEGPAAAGRERDAQGAAAAGRGGARDPAERARRCGTWSRWTTRARWCCPPRRPSTRARRTSRTWWTSSPAGCWTRRGCRTGCTAVGGRARRRTSGSEPPTGGLDAGPVGTRHRRETRSISVAPVRHSSDGRLRSHGRGGQAAHPGPEGERPGLLRGAGPARRSLGTQRHRPHQPAGGGRRHHRLPRHRRRRPRSASASPP